MNPLVLMQISAEIGVLANRLVKQAAAESTDPGPAEILVRGRLFALSSTLLYLSREVAAMANEAITALESE